MQRGRGGDNMKEAVYLWPVYTNGHIDVDLLASSTQTYKF